MAHAKINIATASINAGGVKPATFHDFLGPQDSATPALGGVRPPPDVSPSATSDLGSVFSSNMLERHVGNHLEGIPFYGSRGDAGGPDGSGSKQNISDSFMISSSDKTPQGLMDSQDTQLLSKPKRPHEEEASFGMHQARPIPASYISQNSAAGGNNPSKWDRAAAVNTGPTLQYPLKNPSRTGQIMHVQSHKFNETNAGPCLVSQTAADEGSRTGIKGSGVLSSINAGGAISGRQPAGVLIRSDKHKSGA